MGKMEYDNIQINVMIRPLYVYIHNVPSQIVQTKLFDGIILILYK